MKINRGISIIIPTYNEVDTIKVLLSQLIGLEDDKSLEVIIVDASKSKDQLSTKFSTFPFTIIQSKFTSRAKQMNEGARLAKHDIFYFLHADAIPPKNFQTNIRESILSGTQFGYFSYTFNSRNLFLKINSFFSKFKGFYTGGGDQSFFIKKSIFKEIGGFDESLHLCEDFDMHTRLKKANHSFTILRPKVVISDRKYHKTNYFKINLVNLYILGRFKLGHDTMLLRKQYQKLIPTENRKPD